MHINSKVHRETSDCHATIVKHNSSKYSWRTTVQQVSWNRVLRTLGTASSWDTCWKQVSIPLTTACTTVVSVQFTCNLYAVYSMKLWNVKCKLQYYTYIQQRCGQKPKAKWNQSKKTTKTKNQKPRVKWSQNQKPKAKWACKLAPNCSK